MAMTRPVQSSRASTVAVLAIVIAGLLLVNPAINAVALRATRSDALAARPNDFRFVDTYTDGAAGLIQVWAVLSAIVAAAVVILALAARVGRRRSGVLLVVVLAGAALWALCGAVMNTGSSLWTGPDEWDTVSDVVPAWQQPALLAAALVTAAACVLAIVLQLRRRTASGSRTVRQ